MVKQFRVVEYKAGAVVNEIIVEKSRTPEDAALQAIGESLVRSGHRNDLRVQVYFQQEGQPTSMVRLYRRVEDRD